MTVNDDDCNLIICRSVSVSAAGILLINDGIVQTVQQSPRSEFLLDGSSFHSPYTFAFLGEGLEIYKHTV